MDIKSSMLVRVALVVSLLQALCVTACEIALIVVQNQSQATFNAIYQQEILSGKLSADRQDNGRMAADVAIGKYNALTVYFGLFIAAQVFQLVLCVDATLQRNTIQIIGVAIFNFLSLVYACVQMYQKQQGENELKTALQLSGSFEVLPNGRGAEICIIVLVTLFALGFVYVGFRLYKEFGWDIYKRIGADVHMWKMYMLYHVFIMFLKFDAFFLLGFSVQYIVLVLANTSWSVTSGTNDTSSLVVFIIFTVGIAVVMLALAYWGTRNESRVAMALFILGALALTGYIIYKLVAVNTHAGSWICDADSSFCYDRFSSSRVILSEFIVVSMILLLLTKAVAVAVFRNFGKGLKVHLQRGTSVRHDLINLEAPQAMQRKRWSLD